MIAVDTSVLVHALHRRSPHHERARHLVASLAEGRSPWALPWPCLHECVRLVTSARLFDPPMSLDAARADVRALAASPSVVLLAETERHAEALDEALSQGGAAGALVDVARVAALCREHGITEVYSADLDLLRFPGLRVTNPFAPAAKPRATRRRAPLTR